MLTPSGMPSIGLRNSVCSVDVNFLYLQFKFVVMLEGCNAAGRASTFWAKRKERLMLDLGRQHARQQASTHLNNIIMNRT